MTSRITRRTICLRSVLPVVGAWKTCGEIAAQGHNGLAIRLREGDKATAFPRMILFLRGFHCTKPLFPLLRKLASHQAVFWLDRLILPLGPLGEVSSTLQAQLPLSGFGLLLLFQVRQSGERQRHLIWPERFQEPLFDLRIQSQRPHPLAVCSTKLALVSTTPIFGKFALRARVVQMQ